MNEVYYQIRKIEYYGNSSWHLQSRHPGTQWRKKRKEGSKILLFFSIINFDFVQELFWKNLYAENVDYSFATDCIKVEQT